MQYQYLTLPFKILKQYRHNRPFPQEITEEPLFCGQLVNKIFDRKREAKYEAQTERDKLQYRGENGKYTE